MLRLLLFFPFFIFANETYILPDQAAQLVNTLDTRIEKAELNIIIFTPFLDDNIITKQLKNSAKKGVKITIITSKINMQENRASYLTLFKNISVFTLESLQNFEEQRPISQNGSYICIDNKEVFLLGAVLEHNSLHTNYSFAQHFNDHCEEKLMPIVKRAKPY